MRSATVVRAIYALHRALGHWPTAAQIAEYLYVDIRVVTPLLRELRANRLMKDRQRKRQTVWGPWDPREFG